jgi:hypothetical protein
MFIASYGSDSLSLSEVGDATSNRRCSFNDARGVAQKVVGHEVMGERLRGTEPRAVASGIKMPLLTDEFLYWPNGDSLSRSLLLAVL